MHPPSSELSFPDQEQDITLQPQTPATTPSPKPVTPVNDAHLNDRPDSSSSSQLQHPAATKPDIDTDNRSVDTEIDEQIFTSSPRSTLEDTVISRDVGYVQAMRLWFEMKEEAALKNRAYQRKTAPGAQATEKRINNNFTEEF